MILAIPARTSNWVEYTTHPSFNSFLSFLMLYGDQRYESVDWKVEVGSALVKVDYCQNIARLVFWPFQMVY
ncbi:hypothetical protein [Echinicola salinicaeni]|uniref:hypothetical protein n=1 Tax=Echinicola salinicaeni TaxID=2762757 RepID=UPI0016490CA5|nr:hypothetical protein [Echinicola salinicaeni]